MQCSGQDVTRFCAGPQGTQKVQTAYDTIETDAQAYVLSMLELHYESSQLRNNLRKQHRIWMDFYATIFRVSASPHCNILVPYNGMQCHGSWQSCTWSSLLVRGESQGWVVSCPSSAHSHSAHLLSHIHSYLVLPAHVL